jgi:hypothetical protein
MALLSNHRSVFSGRLRQHFETQGFMPKKVDALLTFVAQPRPTLS